METKPASFWSSLPGVLTGLAAVLTAAAGLYLAIDREPARAPLPTVSPPVAASVPAETATETVAAPPTPATRTAVIEDKDGFVNVRTAPGPKSRIVTTIRRGERFTVTPSRGAWWRVRAPDGTQGYVHASRLRLEP